MISHGGTATGGDPGGIRADSDGARGGVATCGEWKDGDEEETKGEGGNGRDSEGRVKKEMDSTDEEEELEVEQG